MKTSWTGLFLLFVVGGFFISSFALGREEHIPLRPRRMDNDKRHLRFRQLNDGGARARTIKDRPDQVQDIVDAARARQQQALANAAVEGPAVEDGAAQAAIASVEPDPAALGANATAAALAAEAANASAMTAVAAAVNATEAASAATVTITETVMVDQQGKTIAPAAVSTNVAQLVSNATETAAAAAAAVGGQMTAVPTAVAANGTDAVAADTADTTITLTSLTAALTTATGMADLPPEVASQLKAAGLNLNLTGEEGMSFREGLLVVVSGNGKGGAAQGKRGRRRRVRWEA